MGTKEWAIILAALIGAAATLISVMMDNDEAPQTQINSPTDDKISIPAENLLPSITGVTSSETDPQYAGENVHWEAAAFDPEGDQLFYKFLVNGEDQTGWINDKTWTWDNTEDYVGENQIDVRIRDGKHTDQNNFDDHKSVKFAITEASVPETSNSHEEYDEVSNQQKQGKIYLSDLGAYRDEGPTVLYDELAHMKIANVKYYKGVQLKHIWYGDDFYYAYFNLNGEYSRLKGLVGLDDENTFDEDITVTFIGNDVVDLHTINMRPGDFPINVDIDVSGVRKLTVQGTRNPHGWLTLDLIDMELKKEELTADSSL